jgi:ATP-binding cassette subfamily B protein
LQRLFEIPTALPFLVRRLLVEQAAGQWRRYALAFGMMFIAAARTALGTYLIGDVINAAYVDKNLPGIILLALVTATLFAIKGMATYGQSVTMARIGNKIIADNQRRLFARLLQHNVGFRFDRHSTESSRALPPGAREPGANLLITSPDALPLLIDLAAAAASRIRSCRRSASSSCPGDADLRKLVHRIKTIAHQQFTNSASSRPAGRAAGIRTVKAFTL